MNKVRGFAGKIPAWCGVSFPAHPLIVRKRQRTYQKIEFLAQTPLIITFYCTFKLIFSKNAKNYSIFALEHALLTKHQKWSIIGTNLTFAPISEQFPIFEATNNPEPNYSVEVVLC